MGNIETKPSDCGEQPWWSIENETFQLNQPNLSEILASISEPDEIKYPTVREKILAKLRDRKYSASSDSEDQSAGDNHEKYAVIKKRNNNNNNHHNHNDCNEEKSIASRSCSESEPTQTGATSTSSLSSSVITKTQSLDEFKEELRIKRLARQGAINDLRSELNTLRQQLDDERELNRKLRNGDQVIDNNNDHIQIEKKDISIGTDDNHTEVDISNRINDNDSNNYREQLKASCDICIQTDEIQFSNLLRNNCNNCNCNHDNNDENIRNDMRITRSSSDTQQINLKAQLAELQLSLQLANADNLSLTTELAVVKKQVASLKEVIACSRQMIEVRDEQVQQVERIRKLG